MNLKRETERAAFCDSFKLGFLRETNYLKGNSEIMFCNEFLQCSMLW